MRKNKICVVLLVVLVTIFFSGCSQAQDRLKNADVENSYNSKEKSKEDIIKIDFDTKFLNISGNSAEETVEEIKEGGNCLDIYENEDGTVTVEINKKQQEYWRKSRGKLMDELQDELKGYNENYRLEHNNSFTQVDVYYNLELPTDKAIVYVMYAEFLCASYQLFNNPGDNDWRVVVNIYNSDTGKLVKSGNSDADMTYDNSDWEASK